MKNGVVGRDSTLRSLLLLILILALHIVSVLIGNNVGHHAMKDVEDGGHVRQPSQSFELSRYSLPFIRYFDRLSKRQTAAQTESVSKAAQHQASHCRGCRLHCTGPVICVVSTQANTGLITIFNFFLLIIIRALKRESSEGG